MEGAPNDRTSADPPMTPIERQMPSRRGLQPSVTTTNPLRGEKTGRTTKKLTAVKSHAAGQTRRRKPHPRIDIGRKAWEALPIPAGRGRLEPLDRPSSQNDKTSRPKSQNNMNSRPSSLNDGLGPPNNRTIRPDNLIAWLNHQEVPLLENFDGTKDPFDYLEAFKTIMQLQAVLEEIMCRVFPMGLRGLAKVWFNKLESESIGSFVQLSRAFIDHFIGNQRKGRPPTHLLSVKQMEGESLRAFVHRFNEEAMKIDRPKEDVTVTTFMAGLRKGDFLYDLCKDPSETLSELMFHRDHGHLTEDCVALKEQVETLIRQGKLQKYVSRSSNSRPMKPPIQKEQTENNKPGPVGEIRNITGGPASGGTSRASRKAYARQVHNIMVVQRPPKNACLDDQVISFNEEDARGTHQPHDDALIVTINIASFTTRRVMVDNGSLDKDQLRPMDAPLVGFTEDKVCPVGIVTLPITNNKDVFAWSHEDMPGINPSIISHKLNINPTLRPIKQKQRVFTLERNNAIMEEVDKLLTANFIREVFYPDWLANVVMVKKSTGKWRMCVDFTDLNKACPKESFPLPRIDQLLDLTAGHKLLTFMDTFSGYNQIVMDKSNQEKTSFITAEDFSATKNVEVYVDDMLVKSKEEGDHLDDLRETFETLRKYQMKLNPSIEANPDKIKAILEMQPPKTTKEIQRLTGRVAALNRFMSRSTDKCLPFFKTLKKAFIWIDECQQAFEEFKRYLTKPPLLSPSKQGEELYLYLAASPTAVSSALIRKEERRQLPIYYTSRTLRGAEERYPPMEKLAFALVTAARKLCPYFQAHTIVLLTNHPLRKAMNKPDATGRLIQWSIELSEFDIDNRPQTAIKAQALADFIADFTSKDDEPTEDIEQTSKAGERRLRSKGRTYAAVFEPCPTSDKSIPRGKTQSHRENKTQKQPNWPSLPRRQYWTGILYKRSFSLPYLRCLAPDEVKYVMREIHEGICGNHSGARALQKKIVRAGYYWPSMQADANKFVQHCDKCQRFANLLHSPPEVLLKFLVVAIGYFTKWVEAEPLATITEKNIQSFVWKEVICRFGIPRVLVSDNGKQFDNPRFRQFSQELGIQYHYSSPGHPQANGQVEVTNRSLLKLIKTRLEGAKGLWPEELPSILWAYRTTVRIPMGETPFRMTYGNEAVVPVEIGLTTLRTSTYDNQQNEEQLRLNLDLIDEVRDTAKARMKRYQEKMARH
uniref:Integrase catalytic domain-containing protein n=1 Tax=Fagus sylvatica TaxID=28930 RepID=A0A2N9ERP1_FAGSY